MKTGRPIVPDKEKKSQLTAVRFKPDERARVDAAAKKRKQRLSEWMREILLENAPPLK